MRKKYLTIISIIPFLSSCANYNDINFYLEYRNTKESNQISGNGTINTEIYDKFRIYFNIPKRVEINEKNQEDILSFKYDESKFNLKFRYASYYNEICYLLQSKGIFEDELFVVNFDNKNYEYKINSLKPEGYSKIDLNSLSSFKEFKEMIDSIKYHNYEDNYPGLPSWNSSNYSGYTYYYNFNETYNLDYLKYLKDDCYYPSLFDFASPNIMYGQLSMNFDNDCSVKENSLKHTMCSYGIEIGVIDPGCTNPQNPLHYMTFEAIPLNYKSNIELLNESINDKLNDHYYLLSKEYSDLFFNYKINDLDIRLLVPRDNEIVGYFEDSVYSYRVSATYVR